SAESSLDRHVAALAALHKKRHGDSGVGDEFVQDRLTLKNRSEMSCSAISATSALSVVTGVQSGSGIQRRVNLAAVRSRDACQACTSSATESPPNFSSAASARTSATIASPTTAAAGTEQMSLRSTVAGLSVIVARSTERSGFMRVAIGFMYAVTRRS